MDEKPKRPCRFCGKDVEVERQEAQLIDECVMLCTCERPDCMNKAFAEQQEPNWPIY